MPNRLADETSPYLLQHKDNPVEWHPWGEDALRLANEGGKPILLSIGYSACHWCHVMAHESFENPRIAAIMNDNFVNIKVDREERPDLDSIYMEAVQAMTGRGGWPMTMFLTPDGRPFYGGTYFPPEDRQGMPGFPKVLTAVAEAFRTQREEIERSADEMRNHIASLSAVKLSPAPVNAGTLDGAMAKLAETYAPRYGGFGGAPKFPQPMTLEFVLRTYRRTNDLRTLDMVSHTLDSMAAGGIYDHLGGGFARYSVDDHWLVPHFEKMLYDNAQLARLYLEAWLAADNPHYRTIAEETLDYIQRDMTSPEGGFYSAEDADSEGEEGRYYVWSPQEVAEALGPEDAAGFNLYYNVTEHGNFEGKNILNTPQSLDVIAVQTGLEAGRVHEVLQRGRKRLLEVRERRVRPGKDTKVLTAWNGLALRAFAQAAASLGREDYLLTALNNAEFVAASLYQDGRMLRTYSAGRAMLNGYLEDHAFYADGLLSLYETTANPRWLDMARALADTIVAEYWDPSLPGFFDTGARHERLYNRPRSLYDNAIPAGGSVACEVLLKLAAFFGVPEYADVARRAVEAMAEVVGTHPSAFGRMLCAADLLVATPTEVAIIGDPQAGETLALLHAVHARYLPNKVLVAAGPEVAASSDLPLLADRPLVEGRPTAYVCHNYVCDRPTIEPNELAAQLG